MSVSQKNIIMTQHGVTTKSNMHKRRESLSKKSFQNISRYQEKVPMKFKQIKQLSSFQNEDNNHINELDTKYNVYRHGSPNFYSSSIETHKANILKNDVKTLDFPYIDRVIKQIKNSQTKQNSLNLRDNDLYPNSIKNHLSHKFKDLLSDKQEMKDFLQWFNGTCLLIQQKDISEVKKFQEKQIMISSGFTQMIQQLSKLSKTRSQIIKLLWNKQAQQMQQIAKHLTNKIIEMEKSHLIESTKTHQMYQKQIDKLKIQNKQLSQKLNKQTFLNQGYVNTFRMNRKMIKKQQIALKKVLNLNQTLVKENINLMDINTELIMDQSRKISHTELPRFETIKTFNALQKIQIKKIQQKTEQLENTQAKIILYRKLQIATKKQNIHQKLNSIKNQLLKDIKQNSIKEVKNQQISESQLQQKKLSLYNYLIQRFQSNPNEKLSIGDDFLHQDDHEIKIDEIQTAIQKILESKNIENYLQNQQFNNDLKMSQNCQTFLSLGNKMNNLN